MKNRPIYGRIPVDYAPMQDLSKDIKTMPQAFGGYHLLLVITLLCNADNSISIKNLFPLFTYRLCYTHTQLIEITSPLTCYDYYDCYVWILSVQSNESYHNTQ